MNSCSMAPYRLFPDGSRLEPGMGPLFLMRRTVFTLAPPASWSVGKSSMAISLTTSIGTVAKCVGVFRGASFVFDMHQQ